MLAREVSSYLTEAAAGAKTPSPLRRTVCDPNHRVMADLLQPCERSFSAGRHDRQETLGKFVTLVPYGDCVGGWCLAIHGAGKPGLLPLASGREATNPKLKEESIMATARELMTEGAECVNSTESLVEAARKMRDLDVGALPICGEDQRLKGMLTDRDIVVKCLAEGNDPNSVTAGDLAQGKPVTIGADDSAEETLRTMAKHQVRRLPVIDGHQLVGIVAQADVARSLPNDVVGQVLEEVSET
jgi:CBS domain-containing protein